MSPTAASRHAEMFGTVTPWEANRAANSFSVEVWSNVSEATNSPRLNGETISIGTRKPSPIGPAMLPAPGTVASGTVMYSPGVPAGAAGGGTWSKKPPFSS